MTRFPLYLCILALLACAQDKDDDLVELDLLTYGMPIVIKAPQGAVVETLDLVIQKDLTVRQGDDYYIQIFESDALTSDITSIKDRLLSDVQSNTYFDEIVENEKHGFIYKNTIDSAYVNYGFRYVKIQADKEYVFQTGMQGKFTLDDVRRMYSAVQ